MAQEISSAATINDEDLVRDAQAGDHNAFSELVRRYQASSMRLATGVLGNREDAEDEVQKAMCKAFEHLDQFQFQARFATWLHRIVFNQCLMRRQQLRRHLTVYIDDQQSNNAWPPWTQLPCPAEAADISILRQQLHQILKQEMRSLPLMLRSVIELRDLRQLPFPSVAEELGITIPAAKSRLLRARSELKDRLLERHGDSLLPLR